MTHEPPQYPDYGSAPGQGAGAPTPPQGGPSGVPPGYGPPPPGYLGAPGGYVQPPPTSQKAIWAMVLGIVSLALLFVCCGLLGLTIFPAIAAVILGFLAKGEIARSGGALTGHGQAVAGIATGIIAAVLSIAVIVLFVVLIASDNSGGWGYYYGS